VIVRAEMLNPKKIEKIADMAAVNIAKNRVPFTLSAKQMMREDYILSELDWKSISYGDKELRKIPKNKRGVYAFSICQNSDILPPHGYVLYVGIVGKRSDRTLRDRYMDYLNEDKVKKRPRIKRMIGTWHRVLRFHFAPVREDLSSADLEQLERQINTALAPPFSEQDLEAEVKEERKAFRV